MFRFSKILFVAESGVDNAPALAQAVAMAEHHQASLALCGTLEPAELQLDPAYHQAMVCELEEQLARLRQQLPARLGDVPVTVLGNRPFLAIIHEVLRHSYDLVIKPFAHPGLISARGTDKKLLRKCPCPVLMVNAAEQRGYREVLLALEYEPDNPENAPLNRKLVDAAAALALSEFAELHIVHAWRLEHEAFFRSARSGLSRDEVDAMVAAEEKRRRAWLEELVGQYCRPHGEAISQFLEPRLHLVQGYAEDVVPACAENLEAELLVMGTVGRTGIPGFIVGNTAEVILNAVSCSVLALKPDGFVSPVTI